MSGFMQRAKERAGKMMLVVPCGQATVAGSESAAERMRSDIKSALIEVKANGRGGLNAKLPLGVNRITASNDRRIRRSSGVPNRGNQCDQFVPQRCERGLNVDGGRTGFVIVEQCVVRLTIAITDRFGFFSFQSQDFSKPRFELSEIRLFTGLHPSLLRQSFRV